MFSYYCPCILQPVKDPPSNSLSPEEDAEISADTTPPESIENTETNSPLEDNAKTPQSGKSSKKMQQSEVRTTAHLHFKDEELSSTQLPEEENDKNNSKELEN